MDSNPYEVHQVDATCWRIEENGVRAFVVTGTEKAMLVDTGFGSGEIRQVAESLTNLPLMLVNTHSDRDHVGCNTQFETAYMHPSEYERYLDKADAGPELKPLWEGDRIDLGGRVFEVILIPGHTPGSIALLDAENRILIGGDSVQTGVIYMFGPGRNMQAYIASMEKLNAMRSRFDTVYPSHGPIPVDSAILDGLIAGAGRVLRGEVEGKEPDRPGMDAKVYDIGTAKFLCK